MGSDPVRCLLKRIHAFKGEQRSQLKNLEVFFPPTFPLPESTTTTSLYTALRPVPESVSSVHDDSAAARAGQRQLLRLWP